MDLARLASLITRPHYQWGSQTLNNYPVTMDWPSVTMPHLIGAAGCFMNAKSPHGAALHWG